MISWVNPHSSNDQKSLPSLPIRSAKPRPHRLLAVPHHRVEVARSDQRTIVCLGVAGAGIMLK
jgi:hypothetical protein